MSESKWTPAPWRVVRPNHNPKEVYVRDDGGLIAQGPFPTHWEGQDERFAKEVDQYEANAHLIAAAPDLAEALEKLINSLENTTWSSWQATDKFMPHLDAARSALSRAKGETP